MRSHLLARRLAPLVLGLALAATMAACSSSSPTATASPSSAAPASTAASTPAVGTTAAASSPGQAASGDATAQITANWEAFFSGKTSAAKKISLLENGQKFAPVINAQAGSGIAASAGAKVRTVVMNSPAKATVHYDVTLGGTTALANQTGTAVYQDGMWKVGDVSFCQLLTLENSGTPPSVCK